MASQLYILNTMIFSPSKRMTILDSVYLFYAECSKGFIYCTSMNILKA